MKLFITVFDFDLFLIKVALHLNIEYFEYFKARLDRVGCKKVKVNYH